MRREADDDVLGVVGLQFEEVAVVDDLQDQLLDVVGLVRVVGHQRVQRHGRSGRRCRRLGRIGRPLAVVQRQVVEEAAQHQQRLDIVVEGEVGHAARGGVRRRRRRAPRP
jgi:hypothetical protein